MREQESPPVAEQVQARIERSVAGLYRWLEGNRLTRTPWAVVQTFSGAEGTLLSGSMAYYTFLSLLPLLMVGGFVLGTVSRFSASARGALTAAIENLVPAAQGSEILGQLVNARAAFGIVGFLAVTYSGSGFVGALTACLNRMWSVTSGRNPVGQKLVNLSVVFLLSLVLLGSFGLTLWAGHLAATALGSRTHWLVRAIDLVASPAALFMVLLLLYRLLPARELSWRSQVPGAAVATVGIELLKRGFALWASRSAGVAVLPRSLLSVVLLLVWMGFFGQMILYGAAYNVVRQRRSSLGGESSASDLSQTPLPTVVRA